MHQVVAPAVQLKRRRWWTFGKLEKAGINGVVVGDLLQRLRPERPAHLLLEGFGKQPVDVVVAVVHEDKPPILHVAFKLIALGLREFD